MSEPVERFEADWLALREPVDHRARSDALAVGLAAWCREVAPGGAGAPRSLRVVDLGSGSGSNLRWLAPRLAAGRPGPQAWTLVDHDDALLGRAAARRVEGVRATPLHAPLTDVDGRLTPEVAEAIASADVVTASALFDLLSEAALRSIVDAAAGAGAGVLFALSYDGTVAWSPPDPDDAHVLDAVNAHQRRDKGTGPALGPTAGVVAEAALSAAGFRSRTASSPWELGADDAPLVRMLLDGWAAAAAEQAPDEAARVTAWRARRHETLREAFSLRVGHVDVLGLPS